MEQLLNAYYQVLELAKENAFKCVIQIENNKGTGGHFFSVWVKKFDETFNTLQYVPFYTFLPDEIEKNVEKVKQLIEKSSC